LFNWLNWHCLISLTKTYIRLDLLHDTLRFDYVLWHLLRWRHRRCMLEIPVYWWRWWLRDRDRLPHPLLHTSLVRHEIVILSQLLPPLPLGEVCQRYCLCVAGADIPTVVSAGTIHGVLPNTTPARPESIVNHMLHFPLYLCVHVLLLVIGESLIFHFGRRDCGLWLFILFVLLG